jgi:hypothetical protein
MSISVGGFSGDCITTGGWGCKATGAYIKRTREVLRRDSPIDRVMKLDSVLKK